MAKKCKSRLYPSDEPDYYYTCDLQQNHADTHLDLETGREWGNE